jgi:tetratricopeptide (TPR) repeat protein
MLLLVPLLIVATLASGSAVLAQQTGPNTLPGRAAPPSEPERRTPDLRHQSRLDQLFERLAASGTEIEANSLSDQIARIWARSGSDTLDLLMDRVQQAIQAEDGVLALDILDSVLALKPDWAEAYSRRATVHFQLKDFDAAMRDLRQTLVLEPRHFPALAGVGLIFQQGGNNRQALAAFREALKFNPYFKGIRQAAERLAVEHDGQQI